MYPEYICNLVLKNVLGARNPDDPDMSVMVSAMMSRAQARQEAVRKLLRVPDAVKHTGVDRAELIRLQQEDYAIKKMRGAMTSTVCVGNTSSFEKNEIVYSVPRHGPWRSYNTASCTPRKFEEVCDVDCSRYNYWWPSWD